MLFAEAMSSDFLYKARKNGLVGSNPISLLNFKMDAEMNALHHINIILVSMESSQ